MRCARAWPYATAKSCGLKSTDLITVELEVVDSRDYDPLGEMAGARAARSALVLCAVACRGFVQQHRLAGRHQVELPKSTSPRLKIVGVERRRLGPPAPLFGIDVNAWEYVWDRQDPKIPLPTGVADDSDPEHHPITAEQVCRLLKCECSHYCTQIETLKRDGVVHIKGVLNPEWLEHLRSLTEHQVANPHIWASPGAVILVVLR